MDQRDARMQWFRDAKCGMFIHWGPRTVGDREIGRGREANRPWDINDQQTPRTSDPDYDSYFKLPLRRGTAGPTGATAGPTPGIPARGGRHRVRSGRRGGA